MIFLLHLTQPPPGHTTQTKRGQYDTTHLLFIIMSLAGSECQAKSFIIWLLWQFLIYFCPQFLLHSSPLPIPEELSLTWEFEGQPGHERIVSKALRPECERMEALVAHLRAGLARSIHGHLYCFHVRRHLDRYCRYHYCQREALAWNGKAERVMR